MKSKPTSLPPFSTLARQFLPTLPLNCLHSSFRHPFCTSSSPRLPARFIRPNAHSAEAKSTSQSWLPSEITDALPHNGTVHKVTTTVPSSGSSPQLLVLTCLVCPTSNNLIASYLSYCFRLPFPRVQDFWRAAKGKPQTPQCLNAPSCSISSAAIGANVGVRLAPVLWHGWQV